MNKDQDSKSMLAGGGRSTSTSGGAAPLHPPLGVHGNSSLFLDTIPEDSDLEMANSELMSSSEPPQPPRWPWRLLPQAQQLQHRQSRDGRSSSSSRRGSARSVETPSSTGAMEAGHSGSVASEAAATLGPVAPRRPRINPPVVPIQPRPVVTRPPQRQPAAPRSAGWFILVLATLLIAGVTVGIIVAVNSTSPADPPNHEGRPNFTTTASPTPSSATSSQIPTLSPTSSPSAAPSSPSVTINTAAPQPLYSNATIQLIDTILFNISAAALLNTSSAQFRARQWIVSEDRYSVYMTGSRDQLDVQHLIQRYVIVLLYYSLNGPTWNTTLLDPSSHECGWTEIKCNYEYNHTQEAYPVEMPVSNTARAAVNDTDPPPTAVQSISWHDFNLTGSLPQEIGTLQYLRRLCMDGNSITGTLPTSMTRLSRLRHLELRDNNITGNINSIVESLKELVSLDLSHNKLTGPLPDLTAWEHLRYIYLCNNFLTGNLLGKPKSNTATQAVFNGWINLTAIDFGSNRLTGSLTMLNWTLCPNLQYLFLENNKFTGRIPGDGAAVLTNLVRMDLSSNRLTGSLPDWLQYPFLQNVYLNDNNLTGSLGLQSATTDDILPLQLRDVRMQGNNLTGTLPVAWTQLGSLETLILFGNNFTGTLPSNWSSPNLTFLDLSMNRFTGSIPEAMFALPIISEVQLNDNLFTFLPPADFFSSAELVWLHDNRLQGTIPPGWASQWTHLTNLTLDHNPNLKGTLTLCNLTGELTADCQASTAAAAPVTCTCCTRCYLPTSNSNTA